jgi:signal transduction histidine kinase
MELASSLGEAELARQLIAEMFQRGAKPDRTTFELASQSYSGSLSAVSERFEARLREQRGGNPEALAQLFISVVLQVYAETNQASQANHILAKFEGWPPLTAWDDVEEPLLEVSRRRPADVSEFVAALESTIGRIPDDVRGRAALEVARSGDVAALRALLGDAAGRQKLTRRRADLLSLANAYHQLGRDRSYFRSPPRSGAPGDTWIPPIADELAMVGSLSDEVDLKRARNLWSKNGDEWSASLPIDVCLHFVRQARRPSKQTGRILDALSIRYPDARSRIEETADLLDLRGGMGDELVSRLLQPAAVVTYPRAEAYIRATLKDPADQERALARFKSTAGEISPAGRPQLLLRVVTDVLALRKEPDAIRRVFSELAVLTDPDWQAWAHLQVAHDDNPEMVQALMLEMVRAGTTPHLRNLRLVVKALTRAGRLEDAEAYATSNQSDLSSKEAASLVGQVLVAAANVDDLDRASRLRDRIWEMSEALPAGAEAALQDARVRAGLDNPVVGTTGEGVQLKLDSFVQDFAHDLHNMLGRVWVRIDNAIEVLQERGDVGVALRQLAPIESAARVPIQERLDHWRTVADADAADEENCDVAEVTRRVLGLYRREVHSGVRFESAIKPGAVTVRMSTFQLDLVLRHLVDNAVKHLRRVPESNRLVELRATEVGPESSHDGRPWVRISVYDTGPGIAPEHRSAIYESGFTTNPERGIGRGLAIVNGVVKSAGATISVESRSMSECDEGQQSFTQFNLMVPRSIA